MSIEGAVPLQPVECPWERLHLQGGEFVVAFRCPWAIQWLPSMTRADLAEFVGGHLARHRHLRDQAAKQEAEARAGVSRGR